MDKETLREMLMAAGAVAVGFADASSVDPSLISMMQKWVGKRDNAGMDYLERHIPLKSHPESVLPGVRTVISLAFSFAPALSRSPELPTIASYSYGEDYHDILRKRLSPVAENLKALTGGEWRICIDSAPLAERYWAMKSGIGRLGRNGMVIVDGFGSYIFLAEILTTLPFPSDPSSTSRCLNCGKCISECPQGALRPDSTLDCSRCLSYLTIEHKGEWDEEMKKAMATPAGRHTLFGCEHCLEVCPHNKEIPPTSIEEFSLREEYSELTAPRLKALISPEATALPQCFRNSPIRRARLQGLVRNVANLD